MKIKYSDKAKESLTFTVMKELVQLSYSIVPNSQKHIFIFDRGVGDEICVTHYISETNKYVHIYFDRVMFQIVPNEAVILINTDECAYIFMESDKKAMREIK